MEDFLVRSISYLQTVEYLRPFQISLMEFFGKRANDFSENLSTLIFDKI